jgi:hypothetical protein
VQTVPEQTYGHVISVSQTPAALHFCKVPPVLPWHRRVSGTQVPTHAPATHADSTHAAGGP